LLLYVDDIVLTASSVALLHQNISALKWKFVMNDLGPLHHFLGPPHNIRRTRALPYSVTVGSQYS
jgi:hypothetical protein